MLTSMDAIFLTAPSGICKDWASVAKLSFSADNNEAPYIGEDNVSGIFDLAVGPGRIVVDGLQGATGRLVPHDSEDFAFGEEVRSANQIGRFQFLIVQILSCIFSINRRPCSSGELTPRMGFGLCRVIVGRLNMVANSIL